MRQAVVFSFGVCFFSFIFFMMFQKNGKAMQEFAVMQDRVIQTPQDLSDFFPRTPSDCSLYAAKAINRAAEQLAVLLAIEPAKRTIGNTIHAFDRASSAFERINGALEIITMVHPDKDMREAAQKASLTMQAYAVDALVNPALYQAFKECKNVVAQASLTDEERYYLDESLSSFEREGLNLPEDKLAIIKNLSKELNVLVSDFDKNINNDVSFVSVDVVDLQGLDAEFIAQLQKTDDGLYVLGCDYPTYTEVMQNCSVATTRKKLYQAFNNRAYPANEKLFESIRIKRQEKARLLGFASFAALDLEPCMAKKESVVEEFLESLLSKTLSKASVEYAELKNNLPEGIKLSDEGKFFPWDLGYVWTQYKKKHFTIDERLIAEYFPVEKTLQGMLAIYENFLNLKFTQVAPLWRWHDEVSMLKVERKDGTLCGYLYLDLYPRANKYSHACCASLVACQMRLSDNGGRENIPGVAIVIANFPRATADKPALFKHCDVTTFFHEFGHALHNMLGRTELAGNAGTSVKRDFVEMPSQMFEEWMWNADMLAEVSCHYKTQESLPQALLEKKIALKKADSGRFVTRQAMLSLLSLQAHQAHYASHSMHELDKAIALQYLSEVVFDENSHFYASFGHLGGYRSRYYGYMWSKVFALDLFYAIKKRGLTDPAVGAEFVKTILGRGGSCDPQECLQAFLKREPNQEAFLDDLGI